VDNSTGKVKYWTCSVYKIEKVSPAYDSKPEKSLTYVSLEDRHLKHLLTSYGYQLVHFWAEECKYKGLLYLCDDVSLFKDYLEKKAKWSKIKFTHIRPRVETYAADIIGDGFKGIYTVPDIEQFLQDAYDIQAFPAGLALELEKKRKSFDFRWYKLPSGAKQNKVTDEYEFLGDPHIEIQHKASIQMYDCAKKAALEAVGYLEGGNEKMPELEAAINNLDPAALGKKYFRGLCAVVWRTTGLKKLPILSGDFDPFNPFPEGKNIKLVLGKFITSLDHNTIP
jgi:hypothetical protein